MVATVTRELVSVNPATLEPVGSVWRTEPGELPGIVASARAAQERWWTLGPAARARVLREAARVVLAQADEIVDTIVAETAKPRTEAVANELSAAVDHATWLAKHAPRVLADERVRFSQLHLKTKKAWLVRSSWRLVPPLGDAGPEVISVARALTLPWQSTQSTSIALRVSP